MDFSLQITDSIKIILIWVNPLIFLSGIILIFYSNYKKLESMLLTEILKSKFSVNTLEKNNFAFHEWLLEKRTFLGLICIVYSTLSLYVLFLFK